MRVKHLGKKGRKVGGRDGDGENEKGRGGEENKDGSKREDKAKECEAGEEAGVRRKEAGYLNTQAGVFHNSIELLPQYFPAGTV